MVHYKGQKGCAMPYRGHIVNGTVVLDESVPLPEGTLVTVEPAKQQPSAVGRALLDLAGLFPPEDLREIEQALHLPRESRAFLAEKLLESLDCEDDFEVSQEWMAEIRRRCKEMDDGAVEPVPAEQVFDELDRKIG